MIFIFRAAVLVPVLSVCGVAQPPATTQQNPSPMVERTRAHERLSPLELSGTTSSFTLGPGATGELFVPRAAYVRDSVAVVIHFHGPGWLVGQSAARLCPHPVAVTVNAGAGSGVYDRAFSDPAAFDSLVTIIDAALLGAGLRRGATWLTGFSAGHGAVRAILREPRHFAAIAGVLLLDGMHTSYVPEGTVLSAGGALDSLRLRSLAEFAVAAVRGEKRMLITHSEIFPGTFASTTETADWLLERLGVRRSAVLEWGPRGMQQLSEARAGLFELLGFAGNSAPDHVDHLHSLPELLARFSGAEAVPTPGCGGGRGL